MFRSIIVAVLAVLAVLAASLAVRWDSRSADAQSCVPSIDVSTSVLQRQRGEITAIAVTLRATAAVSGGDRLSRVTFTSASNARVEIGGAAVAVPSQLALDARPTSWSFVVGKVASGAPFQVSYVATDLCGEVAKFAGAGMGGSIETSGPTPTPVATGTAVSTTTPTQAGTGTPVPPTPTPVPPSPTASATSQPAFQTGATVSPISVSRGGTVTIQATVTSATATTALVDVEVYDPNGARALRQFFDDQALPAGRSVTFPVSWAVGAAAPTGTYTVKIGVFTPGWGSVQNWNGDAARFAVDGSAPTSTPTPTPTAVPSPSPAPSGGAKWYGVNVAGAEFGESSLPGTLGVHYVYATAGQSYRYFAGKGQTLVRVPFLWERVQPTAFGPLSAEDVRQLRAMLDAAASAGQLVILDMHNYARYYHTPLTRADAGKLADAWTKLAREFRGHPGLFGYEVMNEPHDLPEGSDGWAYLAQAAADGIRAQDAQAWLLIPGYSWQGAWTWPQNNPTLAVRDPSGRLLYAAHQYFDRDGSGKYGQGYDGDGAYPAIGADRLRPFQDWLASRGARGIVTEYGVPDNDPRWLAVLDRFLAALDADSRIAGGTYWAAGPWWGAYPLSVEPRNGQDRPQMGVLERYRSHP